MEAKQMMESMDMTEKLFYEDSFMDRFTAQVISCEQMENGYRVVLDRTAFFPEGGGQFGDTGILVRRGRQHLDGQDASHEQYSDAWDVRCKADADDQLCGGIRVKDTREKKGLIWHVTDEPLEVGSVVEGVLDFEKRFDRMQQHTGEHIVSGIVHGLYGCSNVGFHLGDELTTLDFDMELTAEQVQEVELRANRAVFADVPVEVLYPSKDELAQMEYRSKIEIEGQVRIVSIPGVDMCACCAPHTRTTGETGLIKILSCDRHRGGCRMVMASGMRALKDYSAKQRSVTEVSVALSAKPDKIAEAVLHLKEQQMKLRTQLNQIQAVYLKEKLEAIGPEDRYVCIFEEEMDNMAVRNFVNDAMERCGGICAAFVGADESGYRYIIGSKTEDVRAFAKKMNEQFGGKGGGKPEMVQGTVNGTQAEIREMFVG